MIGFGLSRAGGAVAMAVPWLVETSAQPSATTCKQRAREDPMVSPKGQREGIGTRASDSPNGNVRTEFAAGNSLRGQGWSSSASSHREPERDVTGAPGDEHGPARGAAAYCIQGPAKNGSMRG